jgi:predicted RNA-binding protein (virulence factor B family)
MKQQRLTRNEKLVYEYIWDQLENHGRVIMLKSKNGLLPDRYDLSPADVVRAICGLYKKGKITMGGAK